MSSYTAKPESILARMGVSARMIHLVIPVSAHQLSRPLTRDSCFYSRVSFKTDKVSIMPETMHDTMNSGNQENKKS